MKSELKNRIEELEEKLNDRYLLQSIKDEIEQQLILLKKLYRALYFY